MENLKIFAALAVGAVAGASLRWGLGQLVRATNFVNLTLDTGVFVANMLGCFILGLVMAATANAPDWVRVGLITGFLGSLTTFSSLIREVVSKITAGQGLGAALVLILHLGGGILVMLLGVYGWRLLTRAG